VAASSGGWTAGSGSGIGFHIQSHCNNFLQTVDRVVESRVDWEHFSVLRQNHHDERAALPYQRGYHRMTNPLESDRNDRVDYLERFGLAPEPPGRRMQHLWASASTAWITPKEFSSASGRSSAFWRGIPVIAGKFTFVQIGSPSRTHIKRYHDLHGGGGGRSGANQLALPARQVEADCVF
jgi:hypothetical protein